MEWKEGNLGTARDLYQKALSIDCNSESAARCLQVSQQIKVFLAIIVARFLFNSHFQYICRLGVFWSKGLAIYQQLEDYLDLR